MRTAAALLLLFGLAPWLSCAAEPTSTTETYEATVTFVKMRSEHRGPCRVLDADARWVVGIRKADGTEEAFAIHSPAKRMLGSTASGPGTKMRFSETVWTDETGRAIRHDWKRVVTNEK